MVSYKSKFVIYQNYCDIFKDFFFDFQNSNETVEGIKSSALSNVAAFLFVFFFHLFTLLSQATLAIHKIVGVIVVNCKMLFSKLFSSHRETCQEFGGWQIIFFVKKTNLNNFSNDKRNLARFP